MIVLEFDSYLVSCYRLSKAHVLVGGMKGTVAEVSFSLFPLQMFFIAMLYLNLYTC